MASRAIRRAQRAMSEMLRATDKVDRPAGRARSTLSKGRPQAEAAGLRARSHGPESDGHRPQGRPASRGPRNGPGRASRAAHAGAGGTRAPRARAAAPGRAPSTPRAGRGRDPRTAARAAAPSGCTRDGHSLRLLREGAALLRRDVRSPASTVARRALLCSRTDFSLRWPRNEHDRLYGRGLYRRHPSRTPAAPFRPPASRGRLPRS